MPSATCLPHSILFFLPVDTYCPNSGMLTTIWYFVMWLYHDLFIYPLSKALRIFQECKQFGAALFEQMFESFSKLYSQEWHYFAGLLSQRDKQFPASLSLHCWFRIIFLKCKSNLVTPLLKYLWQNKPVIPQKTQGPCALPCLLCQPFPSLPTPNPVHAQLPQSCPLLLLRLGTSCLPPISTFSSLSWTTLPQSTPSILPTRKHLIVFQGSPTNWNLSSPARGHQFESHSYCLLTWANL